MPLFNILGGIASGLGGLFSSRRAAREQERGSRLGFDYLQQSPVGQTFLPLGAEAAEMRGAALGLGGDPAASEAAFQNFLGSTGVLGEIEQGGRAITGSRAARGILQSGGTGTQLLRMGQQRARGGFQNFLGQLGGIAGQGLQAGAQIGAAGGAAGQGVAQAAGTRQRGFADLARGFGFAGQQAFGGG